MYIYNPACFVSFGNTDNIAIVLIDYFDPTIATIMFCRNYSVIATILAALRCFCFRPLYEKEKALKNAIDRFGIHKCLTKADQIVDRRKKQYNASAIENLPLGDNHFFWPTYTALGFTHEAFIGDYIKSKEVQKQKHYGYNGAVITDTKLNLYTGHFD